MPFPNATTAAPRAATRPQSQSRGDSPQQSDTVLEAPVLTVVYQTNWMQILHVRSGPRCCAWTLTLQAASSGHSLMGKRGPQVMAT